ncbi:hypothetical protein C8J57DRAFT_1525063 [Mycena rebaudengoi]|nr:hypothetical protein C8J57DRAFT_1525063 [Mycena rebaudengoi]
MPAPRHRTDPSIRCHPHPVSHHHTCRCICSARRRRRSSLFSRSQSHIDVGTTAATTAASNPTNIRDMSPSPPGLPPSPRLHPLSTNPTADGRECKRRRERTATGAAALERDRDGHGRRGAERAAPPASQCLRLRGTARSAPSAPAPMPLPVSAAPPPPPPRRRRRADAPPAPTCASTRSRATCPGEPALRIGCTHRTGWTAFKTKVVPRARAEVWVVGGAAGVKFCIRDTKSSSGTFLNHFRLLPANTESRSHQIKDGDILQVCIAFLLALYSLVLSLILFRTSTHLVLHLHRHFSPPFTSPISIHFIPIVSFRLGRGTTPPSFACIFINSLPPGFSVLYFSACLPCAFLSGVACGVGASRAGMGTFGSCTCQPPARFILRILPVSHLLFFCAAPVGLRFACGRAPSECSSALNAAPAPAAPAVPPRAAMGPPKPLADPKCDVLFGPLTWTKDHTGRHANIKADVANTLKEVFTQYNLNSVRFRTRCAHDAAYTICTFDTPAIADWLVIEWARVERGMYIDVTATH